MRLIEVIGTLVIKLLFIVGFKDPRELLSQLGAVYLGLISPVLVQDSVSLTLPPCSAR